MVNFIPADEGFTFAGHPIRKHHLGNWRVEDLLITVHAGKPDADIRVVLSANTANYKNMALDRHAERFLRLMAATAAAPDDALGSMNILLPEDQISLVQFQNDTAPPPPATLPALFEAQAARTPDAPALAAGDRSLSYGQLNSSANILAHALIARGLGPESVAGLCIDRSIEAIIGLLAILKAGAAYVPLDPAYPAARLHAMLNDAQPLLVVGTDGACAKMPPDIACLSIDAILADGSSSRADNPADAGGMFALTPDNAAYVIYTSGSTGTPKGVVVTHAGVAALVTSHIEHLEVTPQSRLLQFASLNFDLSLADLAVAFCSGATLVLTPKDALSGTALRDVLVSQRITHVTLPPAVLSTMERPLER